MSAAGFNYPPAHITATVLKVMANGWPEIPVNFTYSSLEKRDYSSPPSGQVQQLGVVGPD